jgi:hypothetical protein
VDNALLIPSRQSEISSKAVRHFLVGGRQAFLDVGDGTAWIQVLRAYFSAVHDSVATVELRGGREGGRKPTNKMVRNRCKVGREGGRERGKGHRMRARRARYAWLV